MIYIGMSLQAFVTALCMEQGWIKVSPKQQFIAGMIFLTLGFFEYISKRKEID